MSLRFKHTIKSKFFLYLLFAVLYFPNLSFSENITFKYEGYLENFSGIPVNQTIKMKFSIIDNNGLSVWSRERFVSIQDGKLSVVLGKVIPLDKSFFNGDYYISTIVIGNDKDPLVIRPKLTLPKLNANFPILSVPLSNLKEDSINKNTSLYDNIQTITAINSKEDTEFAVPLSYNPNEVSFSIFDDGNNVGIGTNTPKAKLHVNGEIKIESTNLKCDADVEGSMRYNKSSKEMEFCNGSNWKSFCNQCNEDIDVSKGLIAYYPFDSNANDHSGNNNHGIVIKALLESDRFGNSNSAYSFDGTDSYIKINDNQYVDLKNNFTLSAWVKKTGNWIQSHPMIIAKNPINSAYILWVNHDGRSLEQGDFSIRVKIGGWYTCRSGLVPKKDNWYMVTGIRNRDQLEIFVNGKKYNSITIPDKDLNTTNGALTISDALSTTDSFNGLIDDVRIYNRALSISEIQKLYNSNGWQ